MPEEREPVRFDIPSKATILDCYRAFRRYAEAVARSQGETLDPEWYADGPEDTPELYKDQPHLLGKAEGGSAPEPRQ